MELFNISKTAFADFYIKRGDLFYFNFQVCDENNVQQDLSIYNSARMQIRESEILNPVLTFTSTGSSPTINISNLSAGQIIISGATEPIVFNVYYYDLELKRTNNLKETCMSGKIYFDCDYTN